jgi:hypothetical protein
MSPSLHLSVVQPEGVEVGEAYLLVPVWLLPVLFSVTVSEGCGLVFCCVGWGFGAAGLDASLAWPTFALIGLTIGERSAMSGEASVKAMFVRGS